MVVARVQFVLLKITMLFASVSLATLVTHTEADVQQFKFVKAIHAMN